MPAIDVGRDPAHAAAQHELAKPIYPKGSPAQSFGDWFNDLLARVLEKGAALPGAWFTIVVLAIMAGAGVVIAIRVARRTMRTSRRGDHRLFGFGELSAAEHRATAEAYAADGDWAAAIRHRLRAVARGLEEAGVLQQVPGRTANELARAAGATIPALAAELTRAADIFNDVTYGERPGTADAYRLVADLDDHLRTRRPQADSGTPAR